MDFLKIIIEKALYPLMELKNGNKIRKNIEMLKISQEYSPEQIRDQQNEKIHKLIAYATQNIPAYKNIANNEQNEKLELQDFPILSKKYFSTYFSDYASNRVNEKGVFVNKTGGSTSEPVRFYLDRHTVELYEAARWRGLSWWGISPGSRCMMIWGNAIELSASASFKYRLKERFLKNRMIISAYNLDPSQIYDYVKRIDSYRPEYIYGYASAMAVFGELMIKNGLSLKHPLKAVVSTAETLHDYQRKIIEQAFHCRTVNEYGARDGGIIAYECKCGKMHITSENAFLEVVDDITEKPVTNGTIGTLLVTDLNNYVMPRIRYKIGDRASISNDSCNCGVNLPIIEKIDGRIDDMLISKDGNYVHGHIFNHLARNSMTIRQFQITQTDKENALLKIIPETQSTTADVNTFIEQVKEKLPGINISPEIVKEIPIPPSGKFRYAIRSFS